MFVATEAAPWSKVGGLGDVIAALPVSLAARYLKLQIMFQSAGGFGEAVLDASGSDCRGHVVMTVTPRYQAYPNVHDTGLTVPLQLPVNGSCKPSCRGSVCVSNELKQDGPYHDLSEPALQEWASLYHCQQGGVDRIFIDHPLFLDPYKTDSPSHANTYLSGCDFAEVDLRYSILCQAALAAPILFWHQPADHLHKLRLQALLRCLPQTLSGGIAQYVGLDECDVDGLQLHGAARDTQYLAPASTQQHKVSVSMVPGPVSLGGGIAQQKPLIAAEQSTQQRQHQHDKQQHHVDILWPATAGRIAFVGNDWPCFPLSQHLRHLHCLDGAKAGQYEAGTDASTGATQASKPLACTAANSFETHMARLLKSARVAFCIHNLAYQGIFPQVMLHGPLFALLWLGVVFYSVCLYFVQNMLLSQSSCSCWQQSAPCLATWF